MQNTNGSAGSGRRWRVPAVLLVVGLGLVAALLYSFDLLPGLRRDTPFEAFAPQALADYLPPDTAAVYGFDVRQILTSSCVKANFAGPLEQLAHRGDATFPWMKLIGVKLLEDVDRLRIVLGTEDPTHPLFLFEGRFSRDRFKVGPGALEENIEDRFRLYEYRDPHTRAITVLAPAGSYLVVSSARAKVQAALAYAADPHGPAPKTPVMELLKGVDTKQGVWLAAAFHRFAGLHMDGTVGLVLNPIFRYARTLAGGMSFGEKLSGDFHLRTGNEADARELEEKLTSSCTLARGFAELLANSAWNPILRMMGTGEVRRVGAAIDVHCHLD